MFRLENTLRDFLSGSVALNLTIQVQKNSHTLPPALTVFNFHHSLL